MKNKLKRLRNPDPHLRGRPGKRIPPLLRPAGFALLFAALLAVVYLIVIGIPGPLTRAFTEKLNKEGIPVQLDSITLSARHGWTLHNLRVYSSDPNHVKPLLQSDRFHVFFWPEDWTQLSHTEWTLSLNSQQMDVSLGLPWEKALNKNHPFKTINRLYARLQINSSGLAVDNAEIVWGDYLFNANGQIDFPDQKKLGRPGRYSPLQTAAPQVAKMLGSLTFDSPPEIQLHFNIPADAPEHIQARVSLFAAGLQRRGLEYKQIIGEVHLRDNELQLDTLHIEQPNNKQLNISGRYDRTSGTTQLDVTNTLPFYDLLGLLPRHAAARIVTPGAQPLGAADFTATCGPSPLRKLFDRIHLQLHNFPVLFQGITFDPLNADLKRAGSQIAIKTFQTQADGNAISGDAEIDFDSETWRFSAQGRVPAAPIGELLGGGAQKWIDRVEFTNRLANTAVNASWGGTDGTFTMNATVSGRDAVCAGIPFDTLDLAMAYSNRTFTLNPIQATRNAKEFTGTITIDLDRDLAFFDATSGFSPDTIARIIAPNHPTILTNFTFAGPVTSRASGQIDYSGGTRHAAQGSIRATSVSAGRWTADSFASQIEARDDRLIFTNSSLKTLGGSINGAAIFDLQLSDSAAPYQLEVDAHDLDVETLIQRLSAEKNPQASGRISLTLDVTADAKAGFWASANGNGSAEIKNGTLHDLPVLGGFSKLIRTTLPGFSLFSLTTFYSDYELRDGALHSDNVQLGGTLFSARAHGKYSLNDGLDFTVRAEPLRQTRDDKEWYHIQLWAADAIKWGTSPLFDLLEFRLEGTLNEPEWKMKALPKEMVQRRK